MQQGSLSAGGSEFAVNKTSSGLKQLLRKYFVLRRGPCTVCFSAVDRHSVIDNYVPSLASWNWLLRASSAMLPHGKAAHFMGYSTASVEHVRSSQHVAYSEFIRTVHAYGRTLYETLNTE